MPAGRFDWSSVVLPGPEPAHCSKSHLQDQSVIAVDNTSLVTSLTSESEACRRMLCGQHGGITAR